MTIYLGVNAVEANSVRVVSGLPKQQPQLLPGHRLIAVIDDGNYRYAPDLTNSATYNLFTH